MYQIPEDKTDVTYTLELEAMLFAMLLMFEEQCDDTRMFMEIIHILEVKSGTPAHLPWYRAMKTQRAQELGLPVDDDGLPEYPTMEVMMGVLPYKAP